MSKISSKRSDANISKSDRRNCSRYGKRNGSRSYSGPVAANTHRRAVRMQDRKDCRGISRGRECWYCTSWICHDTCLGYEGDWFGEYDDPDSPVYLEDVDADVIWDESRNWLRAS